MTVTVAIPFYGDREMLKRCIGSVLRQTHRDLYALVIADGTRAGRRLPRDSRLHVYQLPENRGAYYARAVALAATTTSHHAIVDADDYVEPDWLERLLTHDAAAVQHGTRITHRPGQAPTINQWRNARKAPGPKLTHFTSHTGLYETWRLRDAGGYSPAYRVGWDSLLNGILRLTGTVAIEDKPLYHRIVRPDSLTQDPATGLGSPARIAQTAPLHAAYREAYAHRNDPDRIHQIVANLTPLDLWDEIQWHADQIK